jgi:hypothetical protein
MAQEDWDMAECKLLGKCSFIAKEMSEMPLTAKLVRERYCIGNSTACARNIIGDKIGNNHVPDDMSPSELDKAMILLAILCPPSSVL